MNIVWGVTYTLLTSWLVMLLLPVAGIAAPGFFTVFAAVFLVWLLVRLVTVAARGVSAYR